MLQLSAAEKYYWYLPAVDMRKGFDSLCGLVQSIGQNVVLGGIFIFCNRRRNQIKLLHWEGEGLAVYYKRLEKGRYELPVFNEPTGPGWHKTLRGLQGHLPPNSGGWK